MKNKDGKGWKEGKGNNEREMKGKKILESGVGNTTDSVFKYDQ